METCHYCFDTVNKLNDEYDILYKQLEIADNIIKKNNYKYCLSLIPKAKKTLKEYYDDSVKDNDDECIEQFEFNPNNFLRLIKEIGTKEDEFGMLIEFLNDD